MIKLNKKGIEEPLNLVMILMFLVLFVLLIVIFSIFGNPFARTAKTECAFKNAELSYSLISILRSEIEYNGQKMPIADFLIMPDANYDVLKTEIRKILNENFVMRNPKSEKPPSWRFIVVSPYHGIRSSFFGQSGWDVLFDYAEKEGKEFYPNEILAYNGEIVYVRIPTYTERLLVVGLQYFSEDQNYKLCYKR